MDKDLEDVKIEIKAILAASTRRMTLSNLFYDYRRMTGTHLPYRKFGFKSLTAFLRRIPDTVLIRGNGRMMWLLPVLRDDTVLMCAHTSFREIDPPTPLQLTPTRMTPHFPKRLRFDDSDEEAALMPIVPKIKTEWDILTLGNSIPVEIWENECDVYDKVRISAIHDLTKFWFTLDDRAKILQELRNDMDDFYHLYYENFVIENAALVKGLYCAMWGKTAFERAIVVQTDPYISIFCVDNGRVVNVVPQQLFYLHKRFAQLPRQALRGRVADVRPLERNNIWEIPAINRFAELVTFTTLTSTICYIERSDTEDNIYNMFLKSNFAANEFIHQILIREGFVRDHNEVPKSMKIWTGYVTIENDIHLLPTFNELETASVPVFYGMRNATTIFPDVYPHYFKKINYESGQLYSNVLNAPEGNNALQEMPIKQEMSP